MDSVDDPLAPFHPVVRRWFADRVGEPTQVQRLAWPCIAAATHVLVTAPTGSGKTLAAFLWALDRLLSGAWPGGTVRVLYVSPLRALNNDVQRNLLEPLAELRESFAAAGQSIPDVRVLTRSGDTPTEERRRMARRPPEILITTPESLNILLTSRGGRAMLTGLATVILDEVHAVVGSKRGVHLITAVERLTHLAGEFQRIALSATVKPLERVAEWVGGFQPHGDKREPSYRRRKVEIIASRVPKRYDVEVVYPGGDEDPGVADATSDGLWRSLVAELKRPLARNRSTLVFANSRRMVEKLTRLVNEDADEELVYSHHGSLSREVRAVVEDRLKRGELQGIVATNSLELGIDIGALDEVVLVQTPPSIASAVQRIGRAGHQVGEVSRARLAPLLPRDLLHAAVMARAVLDGEIEATRPVRGALDVLAQVIVSMTAGETWQVDELFAALRACDPYHDLSRRQFDLVIEMLAGRYAEVRVRGLRPLVSLDRVDGTVRARPGADRIVYLSGGTIPDRGYFHLRVLDSSALLGELDEEFVWERSIGDTFTLGVQTWRIERITHNDVFVQPARARAAMAPFWRADERDRGFELSEKIGLFLESTALRLGEPDLASHLAMEHHLRAQAALALIRFLTAQQAATGALPHRHQLVVEHVHDPQAKDAPSQVLLHTTWGGRVNRPFAMALQAAWQAEHGVPLEVTHDDDCVSLALAERVHADEILALVRSDSVEALLRARLESTGFFGARFRSAAGTALLLPREGFRRRTPLWLSRQRAKELLESVRRFDDFAIVLEAWRTCLQDEFDLANLHRVLEELEDGRIGVREVTTSAPSPFAASVAWKRTNELMYEDDTPLGGSSKLRGDLLSEVARTAHLRPRLAPALVATFQRKLQRTFPGYAPRNAAELLDWVVERELIPVEEWRELLAAMVRDHGCDPAAMLDELRGKVVAVARPMQPGPSLVCAVENLLRIAAALGIELGELTLSMPSLDGGDAAEARNTLDELLARRTPALDSEEDATEPLAELLAEVLRYYGPVPPGFLAEVFGLDADQEREAVGALAEEQRLVLDALTADATGAQICDAENLERLLRLTRAAARPAFAALPADHLPLFLATWQGLASPGAGIEGLRSALDRLFGLPAQAGLWEAELLPARLDPYYPAWLDALLAEGELGWFGCGEERLAFCLAPDRELFVAAAPGPIDAAGAALEGGNDESVATDPGNSHDTVIPAGPGRFSFEELLAHSRLSSAALSRSLWDLVWHGQVTNDSFAAMRRGIEGRFKPAESEPPHSSGRVRRVRFERWKGTRPFAGNWRRLPQVAEVTDALDREETNRDRARILLERYGVLFRELLEHELPALQWPRLFRTLRLMELSGEVLAGQFFSGIAGLQFASHDALRVLREELPADRIWWLCAADTASPCGLGLEGVADRLPRRVATSHLVYNGTALVVTSERRGRALEIRVGPDHAKLVAYLGFLKVLLTRAVRPMRAVVVETINGEPAASSAYRASFAAAFHTTRDGTSLRLMRRY
ncbi:MAG: DEAD/DEAH box helicase [Thermoanaerobaculales bacterium]